MYAIKEEYRHGRDDPAAFCWILDLQREILAESDVRQIAGRCWWIAWCDDRPVGFAALTFCGGGAFLSLAGVLPAHRGRGLHGRLIRARLAAARRLGCPFSYSYTTTDNGPSANNLIKAGFVVYEPQQKFAGPNVVYWYRGLP